MTLVSCQFERDAVHGVKGLDEGEGGFGSRGDEKRQDQKRGAEVIADGGREGQQDLGFWDPAVHGPAEHRNSILPPFTLGLWLYAQFRTACTAQQWW